MKLANIDQYIRSIELQRDNVPSFTEYPFCLPAVHSLHSLKLHPNVTFKKEGCRDCKQTLDYMLRALLTEGVQILLYETAIWMVSFRVSASDIRKCRTGGEHRKLALIINRCNNKPPLNSKKKKTTRRPPINRQFAGFNFCHKNIA